MGCFKRLKTRENGKNHEILKKVSLLFEEFMSSHFFCASAELNVVISPDWDGIVSTCIIAHHAWTRKKKKIKIIGTYDSKQIQTIHNKIGVKDLQNALWIDIDQRFPGVNFCIGQHFLGISPSPDWPKTYVNPNVLCNEREYTCKYPLSTAFLLLYGLGNENDIPMLKNTSFKWTTAHAAIAHTDSSVVNSMESMYRENVKEWKETLFESEIKKDQPTLLDGLIDNTYHKEAILSHQLLLKDLHSIDGLVKCQIPSVSQWKWKGLKHQILNKTAQDGIKHFETIRKLLHKCSDLLGTTPPILLPVDKPQVAWRGEMSVTKPKTFGQSQTSDFQYTPSMDVEKEMQKLHPGRSIMSHAITYTHTCSKTLQPSQGCDIWFNNKKRKHELI